ncbi:MAG TPA: hypothetical protein VK178_07220 [Opitutaceae bacterium]|nr:hypothetical protein [Opitutaceae bacterium]
MDLLTIASGILNGGVIGIFGNLATAWIRREDRKLELQQQKQEHEFEIQKLDKMASIDLAKIEAQMRVEAEKADGAARVAAQQAEEVDTGGVRPWKWAVSTRIIWRQALCLVLVVLTTVIFFALPAVSEGRDMIATAVVTCATSAVLFFYGERMREKLGAITLKPIAKR